MSIDTSKLLANWRTTLNGLLSAAIAVIVAVFALPAGLKVPVYVLAGLRALVGFLQHDAGVTVATTPSNPTPHAEESHETPDDPSATPAAK
jgi:hypothetical protein